MGALQAEHRLVEVEDSLIVARDHETGVGVLARVQQRGGFHLSVERALVAEPLEDDLSVVRLDEHHLAYADDGIPERLRRALAADFADHRELWRQQGERQP